MLHIYAKCQVLSVPETLLKSGGFVRGFFFRVYIKVMWFRPEGVLSGGGFVHGGFCSVGLMSANNTLSKVS